MRLYICIYTHARTHACMRARTHAHTYIYICIIADIYIYFFLFEFFPNKRFCGLTRARPVLSQATFCVVTSARTACKREWKELEKSKTASCKRNEEESDARSTMTRCSDYAAQKFRGRFLVFGKRCFVFASDGRNERHRRGKRIRRGNYQERSV